MLLLHSATTVIGPCVWGILLLTESAMLCSSRCTHWTFPTNCGDWKYVPGHHTPFFQTSRSDQLQQNCIFRVHTFHPYPWFVATHLKGKVPLEGKVSMRLHFFKERNPSKVTFALSEQRIITMSSKIRSRASFVKLGLSQTHKSTCSCSWTKAMIAFQK